MKLAAALIAAAGCASPAPAPAPDAAADVPWTLNTIGENGANAVVRGEPGATELVPTLYQPTGAGDLLVLGVHLGATSTLTPPPGFIEIRDARAVNDSNNDMLELWYAPSVPAGLTSVTVDVTGRMYAAVVWDFSVAGRATLDTAAALSDQPVTPTSQSPTIAMAKPGEIIVAAMTGTARVYGNGSLLLGFGEDSLEYGDGWAHLEGIMPAGSYHETWSSQPGSYCSTAAAFVVSP